MSVQNRTIPRQSEKRRRLPGDHTSSIRPGDSSPREMAGDLYPGPGVRSPLLQRNDQDGSPQDLRYTSDGTRQREFRSPPPRGRPRGYDQKNEKAHLGDADTYRPEYFRDSRDSRYSSPPRSVRKESNPQIASRPSKPDLASVPVSPAIVAGMVNKEKIAQELGSLFIQAIEDLTKSAALKIRQDAAQKEFEKRDEDYKKARPSHEKFPQVEETQRKSRERAEKILKSIKEKSERQSAILKEIAFKSASTVMLEFLSASSQYTSASRRRDEFEKTCQQLQSQFSEMKTYIEEQKQTRVEDEKKREQMASLVVEEFKALKDELKAIKSITSGFPQDLEQKLQSLQDKIKHVSALVECGVTSSNLDDINKEIRQLKKAETSRKANESADKLTDRVKTLEEKQSNATQYLNNTLPTLESRVDVVEKDVKAEIKRCTALGTTTLLAKVDGIEKELKAATEKSTATEEKVASLEREYKSKLSSIKETITNVQNDLSSLESLSIKSKPTAIDTEIEVLKTQARPTILPPTTKPPTTNSPTTNSPTTISSTTNPSMATTLPASVDLNREDIIRTVKKDILRVQARERENIIKTVMEQMVEVNQSIQESKDQIIIEQLEAIDASLKNVKTRCGPLESGLSNLTNEFKALRNVPDAIQTLQQSHNSFATELENTKRSAIDKTLQVVQNTIMPHYETAEQLSIKLTKLQNSSGGINKAMDARIEANEFGIAHIEKRLLNIRTKDMADYMLRQLEENYPYARNCQDMLVEQASTLTTMKSQIDSLVLPLDELNTRTKKLEDQPHGSNGETPASVQAKFDAIDQSISETRSIAEAARAGVGNNKDEYDQYQNDIATQFSLVMADFDDLRKSLRNITAPPPKLRLSSIPTVAPPPASMFNGPKASSRTPTASSPVPHSFSSNGNVARKSATIPTAMNQRSVSIASDNGTKRRKLNGSISSIDSKGTNGVNSTPKSGWKRKPKTMDGDDTDDEDFQPKQQHVILTDDED